MPTSHHSRFPKQGALPLFICLAILMHSGGCGSNKNPNNSGNGDQYQAKKKPKVDSLILEDSPVFRVEYSAQKIDQSKFDEADLRILFIGNSHTRDSPEQLGTLFSVLQPEKKVLIARSAGGFLAEHAKSKNTLDLIRFGKWNYVVLQAQKYSSSGKYTYPTDGALLLAKEANRTGAKVIMFPEWSRRDFPNEFVRVHELHETIASQSKNAVVAPIGKTWRTVAEKLPELDLLHPDGNHASQSGNFINACVFYMMMNDELTTIPESGDAKPNRVLENRIAQAVKEALQEAK